MAVHSSHPVSAPPAAPPRERTSHILLRGWCIALLIVTLSGTALPLAFGVPVAAAIGVVSFLVSVILWATIRPRVQWPRLPWYALAYIVWALASILWTHWLEATLTTVALLIVTTVGALFVGAVLTWREVVRALASALKWMLGLSIVFELWVSLIWDGPILPHFERPAGPVPDPIVLWSRDNLLDGGRIQGIFGNSNALAYVALLAIVVFAIRIASRAPRRPVLALWLVLAVFLFVRAGSATATLSAVAVGVVLITVLVMRTTTRAGERTRYYLAYGILAVGGLLAAWLLRDHVFTALGRSSDLTGRESIWEKVLARAVEHPVIGWGFSTPWIPTDPAFDRWIIDHGQTVMQAHNMWVDVFLQLGAVGIVLIAAAYVAFVWRSWFFAIDRPRWDLVSDRPYTAVTLLPTLTGAILLVQGLAESTPLLNWGWFLLILFAFKIKQAPLVGRGPSEERLIGEQGDRPLER
ncbi:exopolysaccharide production protein ExoQ [Microbacterium sp. SORGH_AS 505]|uniref:O-antigen ligase family protein n=1 Tax=Microbacterium sp. SORGH_AS_0505 TaxID=3041770 RepID=UPI00278B6A1E|nr:O-antigen ligase family protein [Microbacterium sp. SORGH_AS_0505]MDQ1125240.1 exopolysaccharide production protein ExoQ [Microbacterium sp. SORGH_AS_0505]